MITFTNESVNSCAETGQPKANTTPQSTRVETITKTCYACGQLKTVTLFAKKRSAWDTRCKSCRNKKFHQRYRLMKRARNLRRRRVNIEIIEARICPGEGDLDLQKQERMTILESALIDLAMMTVQDLKPELPKAS